MTKPESQRQEVKQDATETPQSCKSRVLGPFDPATQRGTTLGEGARGLGKSMVQSSEAHASQKSFFASYIAQKSIKIHRSMYI